MNDPPRARSPGRESTGSQTRSVMCVIEPPLERVNLYVTPQARPRRTPGCHIRGPISSPTRLAQIRP